MNYDERICFAKTLKIHISEKSKGMEYVRYEHDYIADLRYMLENNLVHKIVLEEVKEAIKTSVCYLDDNRITDSERLCLVNFFDFVDERINYETKNKVILAFNSRFGADFILDFRTFILNGIK